MLTFSARVAASASGIPHNTINSLLNRGVLVMDGEAPGQGKAREYGIASIARLGLMGDLMSGLGMRPEEAHNVSLLCAAPFQRLVLAHQQTPGTAYLVVRFVAANQGYESAIVYGLPEVERLLEEDGEQPYALVINITKAFSRTIARLIAAGALPGDWQAHERADAGLPLLGSRRSAG